MGLDGEGCERGLVRGSELVGDDHGLGRGS